MKRIAIIPARGGSKRIPRKNIKKFCGRPIIEYSIEVALASGLFDLVLVSTDDEEIRKIAVEAGAKVPFLRSAENSGDIANTAGVIKEVLLELARMGQEFEQGCCIYPTAPFVTTDKLSESIRLLTEKECATVVPVVPYSFPVQRSLEIEQGYVKIISKSCYGLRSQDLKVRYHDCGQFYTFNVSCFCKLGELVTNDTVPMIMKAMEVQDIDNYSDWEIAELKYQIMKRRIEK